jgi:hypothetical protein
MRVKAATATIAVLAATALFTPASSLAASPVWQLVANTYSTHLVPGKSGTENNGPGYVVMAKNIGAEATSGEFKISAELPVGINLSPEKAPSGHYAVTGPSGEIFPLACEGVGRSAVCRGSKPVKAGQDVVVLIPVEVTLAGEAPVVGEFDVEGGGASAVGTSSHAAVSAAPPAFGFVQDRAGAYGTATDANGGVVTRAGSHPYQLTVGLNFNDVSPREIGDVLRVPGGGVRSISGELPRGMIVDPAATPTCTEAQLESAACPNASQVGTITPTLAIFGGFPMLPLLPLYNMEAVPGTPAVLGFEVIQGVFIHLIGRVRTDGDYGLSADVQNITAKVGLIGADLTLWGSPSDEAHDPVRGQCVGNNSVNELGCSTEHRSTAFLTMPSSCTGSLDTALRISNWIGELADTSYANSDAEGSPVGVEGCGALEFQPTIESQATTDQGESPSGLEFDLHQTQHEGYEELATANLENASVVLPEGLVLNPSTGNGLEACSSGQIGLTTPIGQAPVHFTAQPQSCPAAAKLGTAEVITPLLKHPLPGSVYLAKPFDNPFGSLLGIYIAVEDEETGIIAKLAGKVTPDPTTGRLTTSFSESPELPLEDVRLRLYDGVRAALTTPLTCGTKTTTSTLTPWSTPEGQDAHPQASFQTQGGCYGSEGQAPKSYSFTAGTQSPLSGSYSPFVLRIARPDGSQHITGLETTLPEGLLGKLAGVSYCPESGIAQARSREAPEKGKEEQSSPSCPSSSEVGSVNVTAGSGIAPIPVSGHAYLAGPYKGAPVSLVVIVPAVAGPFDLGTVVDRVALNVGEYDARIHAVADPLPTIRDGIPLDVRSIELKLDRPNFTLNPTSCEAKAIEGSASTQAGQSAALNNRFQVGECGRLAFKPKVAISLKGPTKRTGLPALKATVTYPKDGGYANIARAQVSLPKSEFLEQGNIGLACTKPVLQAHACPAKSVYGKAKAWSPLLAAPLEGPVYLVGGYGYKLPAMVAELDGQIRVLLVGKVDTGPNRGIRNTFEAVPDAPVEKFVLELKGGKKYGLLVNSEDICKEKQVGQAAFTAQNGKTLTLKPVIANSCGKAQKGKGKKHKKGSGHKKSVKGKGHTRKH